MLLDLPRHGGDVDLLDDDGRFGVGQQQVPSAAGAGVQEVVPGGGGEHLGWERLALVRGMSRLAAGPAPVLAGGRLRLGRLDDVRRGRLGGVRRILAGRSELFLQLLDDGLKGGQLSAQKRAAEAKAKQKIIEIKEVKFRPGTDEGDYQIKMRNLRRFIAEDGDKGKVTLRYRGREITHQDIGMRLLERIRDELADVAVVEHMPKLEGRQMIMVLAPKKKQ